MRYTTSLFVLMLIGVAIGCDVKENTEASQDLVKRGWQPASESQARLDTSRKILAGKGSIQPPKNFEFEEQVVVSDPVAVFKSGSNRIEILMSRGLPQSVTCEQFAGTTKQIHASVSELEGVTTGAVKLGEISGKSVARFRYQGTADGKKIEGVYYIWRPDNSGPIWNLVAEGEPDQFPLLEASVLTFRDK